MESMTLTRDIAAQAIRDRLIATTHAVVLERGYAAVTLPELAEAAGVSRSTYIRYVGSKPEAVAAGLLGFSKDIVSKLQSRPLEESPWASLRHAMEAVVDSHPTELTVVLELTAASRTDPGMAGAFSLQRNTWRNEFAEVLRSRNPQARRFAAEALAAAAVECLDLAIDAWLASNGAESLSSLLDESFGALEL